MQANSEAKAVRTGGRDQVRKLTVTAMLSAVAFVLMFLDFPLWAPGPGRLAGGASAWCEVCGDGLYGELILTDKVSRGAGRRVT